MYSELEDSIAVTFCDVLKSHKVDWNEVSKYLNTLPQLNDDEVFTLMYKVVNNLKRCNQIGKGASIRKLTLLILVHMRRVYPGAYPNTPTKNKNLPTPISVAIISANFNKRTLTRLVNKDIYAKWVKLETLNHVKSLARYMLNLTTSNDDVEVLRRLDIFTGVIIDKCYRKKLDELAKRLQL